MTFSVPSTEYEAGVLGYHLPMRKSLPILSNYGCRDVAAQHCGFEAVPDCFPGEWQHGWHPPEHNFHPELVASSDGFSANTRTTSVLWVARTDQADYLRSHGYTRVEAIGLPIVYIPTPKVVRTARSLLVMPIHSLDTDGHCTDFEEYAEHIRSISHNFSKVVVCVHGSCFSKGYWVEAFRSCGIPVISGADATDQNCLYRMAAIFSGFEFLTSNGFGSHLVYGASFGCRPSIHGPFVEIGEEEVKQNEFSIKVPETTPRLLEMHNKDHLQITYPHLFCEPWQAEESTAWGEWQIGKQCKRSPSDLRRLFRWSFGHRLLQRAYRIVPALKMAEMRLLHPGQARVQENAQLLRNAHVGELIRIRQHDREWHTQNGELFLFHLQAYVNGSILSHGVNPVDAPVIDFSPDEGCAVIGLHRHHPYRPIYYASSTLADDSIIAANLQSSGIANLVPFLVLDNMAADAVLDSSVCRHAFTTFIESENTNFQDVPLDTAVLVKIQVCESCCMRLATHLSNLCRLKRIVIECTGRVELYLGPLLADLLQRGFQTDVASFHSFRIPAPDFHSRSTDRLLVALSKPLQV